MTTDNSLCTEQCACLSCYQTRSHGSLGAASF